MSIDEKINEALGISNNKPVTKAVVKKEYTPPVPRVEDKNKEDVDNDYKYSRENYYNLIERGQDAIQGILDIANESQHPRAYEVAGNLIKQVADTVDKLQDLQGKLKTLKALSVLSLPCKSCNLSTVSATCLIRLPATSYARGC